jgi:hypothetical protein
MPDGVTIPGGPSFGGYPQPPDVPCDPTGDGWRGPPGPPGPAGAAYTLPTASTAVLGGVKIDGTTITIASGVISAPATGVTSFNTRTGAIALTSGDVTTVLPPSSTTPSMDGSASVGTGTTWARADHVHPVDTSRYAATNPSGFVTSAGAASAAPVQSVATRTGTVTLTHSDITDWGTALAPYAPLASPTFTGTPAAPTPTGGDNSTKLATTAFVAGAVAAGTAGVASFNTRTGIVALTNADVTTVLPPSSTTPAMDGTAAVGTGTTWARADHVHPTDTSRAAVSAIPAASSTTPIMDSVAAVGVGTTWARADHVHPTDTSRLAVAGTATNNNAAAGAIGEVISSVVTTGVTLTNTTDTAVTSISLTAGDWDVSGEIWLAAGTGGATSCQCAMNTTAAMPANLSVATVRLLFSGATPVSNTQSFSLRTCRASLAVTTSYFLVINASFPSGTCTATGAIWARRAR